MSGPKCAVAPPRFSASVFDGQLGQLLMLQGEVERLAASLAELAREGEPRGEDLSRRLRETSARVRTGCAPVRLDIPAEFGPTERDAIGRRIAASRAELEALRATLESVREEHVGAVEDDRAFERWERYRVGAFGDFQRVRDGLITQARALLGEARGTVVEQELRAVPHDIPAGTLGRGLRLRIDRERAAVEEALVRARAALQAVYACHLGEAARGQVRAEDALTIADRATVAGVRASLHAITHPARHEQLARRLDALIGDPSRGSYALRDLREEAHQAAQAERRREAILALYERLEQEPLDALGREALRALFSSVAERLAISDTDLARAHRALDAHRERVRVERERAAEREFLRRERELVRRTLVAGLQSRGYAVIEDVTAVDFSDGGDLLMSTPGAEGMVHLAFDPEGRCVMHHVTDGVVEDMSAQERSRALAEMTSACEAFERTIGQMRQLGITVELKKQPSELRWLLPVPIRHNARLAEHRAKKGHCAIPQARRRKRS